MINLPIFLFQGHTVLYPENLILDLKCWLQPAMVYVSLSRVQRLEQLYILDELPKDKMKPWPDALEEMRRLDDKDQNSEKNKWSFKLTSMNIYSLRAHFADILADNDMNSSDVICLQESWLGPDEDSTEFDIPSKQLIVNSIRRGAGIATYFSDKFQELCSVTAMSYQLNAVSSKDTVVVNIYRSSDANDKVLLKHLERVIQSESEKSIFICGDWNFCHIEQRNHAFFQFLLNSTSIQQKILSKQLTNREDVWM